MDSSFLKDTVGDALASACTACCVAQPSDPITYVGKWLLKYVESDTLVQEFNTKVKVKIANEAENEEELANRGPYFIPKFTHSSLNSINEGKTFADVFTEATNEIVSLTGASACYVGVIADAPEPDAELPEGLEEGEVPEFLDLLAPTDTTTSADGEPSEGETDADTVPVPATEDSNNAATEESAAVTAVDYSNSTIEYVSVSVGSSSVKHKTLTSDEGITFSLLGGDKLFLYEPNVMYKKGVKYFNNMPRVGSYMAVKLFNKERSKAVAIVCCDTLMPLGSGKTLSDEDKSTISACTRALQRALDGMSDPDPTLGTKALKDITDELSGMTQLEFEEPTSTSEEMAVGMKKLDFVRDQHTKITAAVQSCGMQTIDELLSSLHVPKASYKVLRSILLILGKDEQTYKTWYLTRHLLSETLLEEIAIFDPSHSSGMSTDTWRKVYQYCFSSSSFPSSTPVSQQLASESIGSPLLFQWLLSARSVAKIASQLRVVEEKIKEEQELEEKMKKEAEEEKNDNEEEDAQE